MQMCQATLFLPFIFQAAPAPSAEHIAQVVDSATRMFLAAYRSEGVAMDSDRPTPIRYALLVLALHSSS